jgi:hypothetical protein
LETNKCLPHTVPYMKVWEVSWKLHSLKLHGSLGVINTSFGTCVESCVEQKAIATLNTSPMNILHKIMKIQP